MNHRHLLFKYATRSRPERMFAVIDSIIRNLSNKKDYTILITADLDDIITYNQQTLQRLKAYFKYYNVRIVFGESDNKVDAINRDMELVEDVEWHDIVLIGDYIEFTVKGFDDIIRKEVVRRINIYQQSYNELHHSSHIFDLADEFSNDLVVPVIGRYRYLVDKYILNPDFTSKFALEEVKRRAMNFGYYDLIQERLFKRKHPVNLYYSPDLQMQYNTECWRKDLITLEEIDYMKNRPAGAIIDKVINNKLELILEH